MSPDVGSRVLAHNPLELAYLCVFRVPLAHPPRFCRFQKRPKTESTVLLMACLVLFVWGGTSFEVAAGPHLTYACSVALQASPAWMCAQILGLTSVLVRAVVLAHVVEWEDLLSLLFLCLSSLVMKIRSLNLLSVRPDPRVSRLSVSQQCNQLPSSPQLLACTCMPLYTELCSHTGNFSP